MQETFFNSKGEIIRLGQRVGAGGEGGVYGVQNRDELVAKVYYEMPPAEKAKKLVALTRLGSERLRGLSAWPIDVLRDRRKGRIAGYVMNRLTQAEEVHTLHSPKSRLQKFPGASWAFLIHVAANFARAVAVIHEHGLVIGDVNPKNALVTRQGTIFMLDCDSFQVSIKGKKFRCEFGMPEYTPPELQGTSFRKVDRRPEHDCFGLAVVIFQLLFLGRHPFSGRFLGEGEMPLERAIRELRFAYALDAESRQMISPPGALEPAAVSTSVADLFGRAFTATSADRPKASDWIAPLDLLAKSLRKCCLHDMHYYYAQLSACPWCEIEAAARVTLFNLPFDRVIGRGGHFRLDKIWRDIEAVQAPPAAPVYKDGIYDQLKPSGEAVAFGRRKGGEIAAAVFISALIGFAAAWFPTPSNMPIIQRIPLALVMAFFSVITCVLLVVLIIDRFSPLQRLFDRLFPFQPYDDPFIERLERARGLARAEVERVEKRWKRESDEGLFSSRLAELQSDKREYERLAGMSYAELRRLESRSPHARAKFKRAIGKRLQKLETKLAGGAIFLYEARQEIEENRRKLFPAVIEAHHSLAQAERDLKTASKSGWSKLAVIVLIIAFAGGSVTKYARKTEIGDSASVPSAQAPANNDNTVKLWDAQTEQELATLKGHDATVYSVAFSPNGRMLASGSMDDTVKLWDARTKRELATLKGHGHWVRSVAFSPDGKTLASGSYDNTVKLWDARSRQELAELKGHTDSVNSVAFSPDGKTLASGSWDNTVKLWDARFRQELATLNGHAYVVSSVAFSPDGKTLASGSWDNTVKLWDARSRQELATLNGHAYVVSSVAFSPDGKTFASGGGDKTVKLWVGGARQ